MIISKRFFHSLCSVRMTRDSSARYAWSEWRQSKCYYCLFGLENQTFANIFTFTFPYSRKSYDLREPYGVILNEMKYLKIAGGSSLRSEWQGIVTLREWIIKCHLERSRKVLRFFHSLRSVRMTGRCFGSFHSLNMTRLGSEWQVVCRSEWHKKMLFR